jgi:hypothetical protein
VDQAPITIGVTANLSKAFGSATRFVRLNVDATCSFVLGANPVATGNNARMYQNTTEYFAVNAGDSVSVITNS